MANVKQLPSHFRHVIWEKDRSERGALERLGVRWIKIVYGIALKFVDGQLTLWAMSLVYTTLLSLVPMVAVSFSVLKAFGVHNQLEAVILEFLAPLGEQGVEISQRILGFVQNVNAGVLGSVGIAFLFFTVISLIQKVEQAFNFIWHVPNVRSLARRFSDYLSVIVIGPVLLFGAVGFTASVIDSAFVQWLISMEPFGTMLLVFSRIVPYLLICGAFAFMYGFLPNTHVGPKAALVGGLFAGVLWYTVGVAFTAFVVKGSNYSAIYSGFAAAVLFMIWLYIGWLIVLVGAQVAFYWQHPQYLDPRSDSGVVNSRRREQLALEIMALIGRAHYGDEPSWSLEGLKTHFPNVHPDALARVIEALEGNGIIIPTADDPPAYLPARSIETITLERVVRAARGGGEIPTDLPGVGRLMDQIDTAIHEVLQGRTVKDLVLGEPWEDNEPALNEAEASST